MDAYKTISYPRELALGTCFGNVAFGDPTERLILVMHPCSQYPTASTGRLQDALVLGSVPTMDEDPFDLVIGESAALQCGFVPREQRQERTWGVRHFSAMDGCS